MSSDTDLVKKLLRPSYFEIDLDSVSENIKSIQEYVGYNVKVFAVLKCNAYGFGLIECAKVIDTSPAYALAVADLYEAIELRKNKILKPILVYANNLPDKADLYPKYNLTPTIDSLYYAEAYNRSSKEILEIFIKIDTGRCRNGIPPEDVTQFCDELKSLTKLKIKGLYAHMDRGKDLSNDQEYVQWQYNRFKEAVDIFRRKGIKVPIKMLASSAEVLQYPNTFLDAVDVGKLIYGIHHPENYVDKIHLKPVFKGLKSRLISVKNIEPDQIHPTYCRFEIKKTKPIGIIPLGWGDGLPQVLSGQRMEVLVNNQRTRIIPPLYVEHARIDLSGIDGAKVGDEVVLIGKQGDQEITLDNLSKSSGISGSVLTRIVREQVPRLFYKNGAPYRLCHTGNRRVF